MGQGLDGLGRIREGMGRIWPLVVVGGVLVLLVLRGPALWDSWRANMISIGSLRSDGRTPSPRERGMAAESGQCATLHARGRAYLVEGRYEEAVAELERAVVCSDDSWAWFDLGRAQYGAGRLEETAVSWRKAGAFGYAEVLAYQAAVAGDSETSFSAWKLAVAIDPMMPRPYLQIGSFLQAMGCPAEARSLFEHLADLGLDAETTSIAEYSANELAGLESDVAVECPEWE